MKIEEINNTLKNFKRKDLIKSIWCLKSALINIMGISYAKSEIIKELTKITDDNQFHKLVIDKHLKVKDEKWFQEKVNNNFSDILKYFMDLYNKEVGRDKKEIEGEK